MFTIHAPVGGRPLSDLQQRNATEPSQPPIKSLHRVENTWTPMKKILLQPIKPMKSLTPMKEILLKAVSPPRVFMCTVCGNQSMELCDEQKLKGLPALQGNATKIEAQRDAAVNTIAAQYGGPTLEQVEMSIKNQKKNDALIMLRQALAHVGRQACMKHAAAFIQEFQRMSCNKTHNIGNLNGNANANDDNEIIIETVVNTIAAQDRRSGV